MAAWALVERRERHRGENLLQFACGHTVNAPPDDD